MCTTCVFRTVCEKVASYHHIQLVEVIGEGNMMRPARKSKITTKDTRAPQINGKELSENTRSFLKELSSLGYDKKELNDLMKLKGREGKECRSFPWLMEAIAVASGGCKGSDIRDILASHSIRGTLASARATQFIKVLVFYDLLKFDEKTERYVSITGETI